MSKVLQAGLLNQSSAQVVDGSLRFAKEPEHRLTRAMTDGSHQKFTISCWLKPTDQEDYLYLMGTSGESQVYITNTRKLTADFYHPDGSTWAVLCTTDSVFRDPTAFYHLVITLDSSSGSRNVDRFKVYVNGEQQPITFATYGSGLITGDVKHVNTNGQTFQINSRPGSSYFNSFYLSQYNYIDGLAIGPGYFGFTDPLTGTWRPKKFKDSGTTVNDGTTWSGYGDGNAASSYEWTHAFDGSFGANDYVTGTATYTTITFPEDIEAESIYLYLGTGTTAGLRINGIQIYDVVGAYNSPTRYKVGTNGEGNFLKTISLYNSGTQWSILYGIDVDGVLMRDGITQNIDFGTNGFYLPMDGNSPIGEDKSGQGNDLTPVNFGGSAGIDKATGALPILNTTQGGTQATVGVLGSKEGFYKTVNSASGGGNPYIFDREGGGTLTQPTLNLIRGVTYSFDYSAASSHPLYLSSLNDGKHNSKAYSVLFDGNGDELEIADHNDFNLASGDFTIEGWVYVASAKSQSLIGCNLSSSYAGYEFDVMSDGRLNFYSGNGSSAYNSTTLGASSDVGVVELNEWTHIAAVRSGTTLTLFRNGSKVAENASFSHTIADSSTALHIGSDGISTGTSYHFHGYISNLRMIKGTALYSNNGFDVPSTTLTNVSGTVLLCCQDNNATTAVVSPSALSVVGNTAANNSNPYVYTDNGKFGLNTATSNVTKYTIPHIFNDTLYYFCNNHSGMGGSVNLITDETKADPYAWKNILALPLVGNSYDVSDDVNCTSTAKAISENGDPSASLSRSNFYNTSYHFDGSGDYLSVGSASDFELGIQDFTIEMWLNMVAA